MDFGNIFPDELIEKIFKYLIIEDICTSCLVCSKWRRICNSEKIWQKQCKIRNWTKYGYGALDLMYLPSSDKVLSRTNVSGTSPKFEYDIESPTLPPLGRWRMTFIKSKHLESNWIKGHYNVLPTLRAHEARVAAFDSDGMVLVSGSADNIAIWDLDNLIVRYQIPVHKDQVNKIQLMGHFAAMSFTEGAVKVYNVISGKLLMTFYARCAAEHLKFVNKDLIVCTYSDRALRVWSLKDRKLKYTMRGHTDEIECLIVRGDICVTGAWDGMIILWNMQEGEMMFALQGHEDSVMCCDMDDDEIVSGSGDGTVRVWRSLTADCRNILESDLNEVYCLKLTPTLIAAGGTTSKIIVWNRKDLTEMFTLKQHLGIVRTLSLNGDLLISGGDRKMICVWSMKTGKLMNVVHRNPDLLHLMFVNETKIITASPNTPGSITVLSYW